MEISGLDPNPNEVITVGDFTLRVKGILESRFSGCWIRGEVSNLRRQASGHVYFTLKDKSSQLSCVMFKGNASRQVVRLRDGLQVVVFGEVSVYEPRGNYQLICRMLIEDGLGKLQLEYERLKKALSAEGLFDDSRKKTMPLLPKTIGVVTSPTGAALRDFISILRRREWGGRLLVLPAKVQGQGAAEEIVSQIEMAERFGEIELLIVGRGGGSLEDLWCFNEECVARAIARTSIPVISAVGHEIDFVLSDFAADIRAETPSAAAELISSQFIEYQDRFENAANRLWENADYTLEKKQLGAERLLSRLQLMTPQNRIEQSSLRIDDLTNRLGAALKEGIMEARSDLSELSHRLAATTPMNRLKFAELQLNSVANAYHRHLAAGVSEQTHVLGRLQKRLENSSLQRILKRGFVVVRDSGGKVVTSREALKIDDELSNDFYDGEVAVTVSKI